jgi:hypothetical protein
VAVPPRSPSTPDRTAEVDVAAAGQGTAQSAGAAADGRTQQRTAARCRPDRGAAAGPNQAAGDGTVTGSVAAGPQAERQGDQDKTRRDAAPA